jgi:hypothetical protein
MPSAVMMDRLATALQKEALQTLRGSRPELIERLAQRGSLTEVVEQGLDGIDDVDKAYIDAIPQALREAVRAAVVQAVDEEKSVNVQYSPAYDFEVRLWDYGDAVGVHVLGPYPPTYPRDGYQH